MNRSYFSPGTEVGTASGLQSDFPGPHVFASTGPFHLNLHWYKDKYSPGWILSIFFF